MVKGALLTASVLLTICIATIWQPLTRRATVIGLRRSQDTFLNNHGTGQVVKIPNTIHCEDVHYHSASNKLYTACEGDADARRHWFPPLGHFDGSADVGQGNIRVIDPVTFESTQLVLSGFAGPLVTHGIDIFPSEDEQSMTIFAINHLPNPEYEGKQSKNPSSFPARSQVEVFRHTVGTNTAVWVRSVRHPRIRTPNDIYATSETSFYFTNDHYYLDGLLRKAEDLLEYYLGQWSDVVHIEFTTKAINAESGVTATTALARAHNPNGLGHTTRPDEVLLVDASGGDLFIMGRNPSDHASKELTMRTRIQLDSTIDNPSYYTDLYATEGDNATGYILAGLPFALALGEAVVTKDEAIPSIVWHIQEDHQGHRQKKAIFQDDGKLLRSASAAVLVGIDPASNGGKKQGWLFATGFVSESMIAVKLDL